MAVISLIQLQYQDHHALGPIQLTIQNGECLVLLGTEHSGHTNLLHLIAGHLKPTKGRIWIQDIDVTQLPSQERNLAWINFARPTDITITGADFVLQSEPGSKPEGQYHHSLTKWLEPLELLPLLNQPLIQLSEIEFQRLALARVLVKEPAIVLCAPISDDPSWRLALRRNLQCIHRRTPTSIVYATSDYVEAMMLADRIALLHDGQLEQLAIPKELYQSPASLIAARQSSSAVAAPESVNLIPTRLTRSGLHHLLTLGSLSLPLPASRRVQDLLNRELILGLRPEHIRLGDYPLCVDDLVTEGQILTLELLGAEYQLVLLIGGVRLTTRVSSDLSTLTSGLRVPVILRLRYLHLFDALSGKALSSPPSPLGVVNDDELIMI